MEVKEYQSYHNFDTPFLFEEVWFFQACGRHADCVMQFILVKFIRIEHVDLCREGSSEVIQKQCMTKPLYFQSKLDCQNVSFKKK